MTKEKVYKTLIPLPIYGYRIYIIFAEDLHKSFKDLKKELKTPITWEPDSSTEAFHFKVNGKPTAYLFFHPNCNIDQMVHESFHAIFHLMKWIGAEIEDEVFAYHLGYFLNILIGDQNKAQKYFAKPLDKQKKPV